MRFLIVDPHPCKVKINYVWTNWVEYSTFDSELQLELRNEPSSYTS